MVNEQRGFAVLRHMLRSSVVDRNRNCWSGTPLAITHCNLELAHFFHELLPCISSIINSK